VRYLKQYNKRVADIHEMEMAILEHCEFNLNIPSVHEIFELAFSLTLMKLNEKEDKTASSMFLFSLIGALCESVIV
jgi:hypothetical protein